MSGSVPSDHPTSPPLSKHGVSSTGRFLNENPALKLASSFNVTVDASALGGESQNCKHREFPLTSAQRCSYL